jgi:S-formylglutathione hydrolase FrmB
LYLLHGYGGWHSNWVLRVPELGSLANDFNTIIVCPEGGTNSWYFDSPILAGSQYETFVGVEVPAFIDSAYRSQKSSMARMISGLSMGGHGAMFIALRHPETFGIAGSMSGGLDLYASKGKFEIAEKIGDSTGWKSYSVLSMLNATQASKLKMLIDCGVDDFFLQSNRAVHQTLVQMKVPHTYIEKEGGHSWEYWRKSIPYHLFFFQQQRQLIAR